MGVNLQKGQRVDLTKGNAGLTKIMIGLGWDPVKQGFFKSSGSVDCDASVIMLDANNKFSKKENLVYFGNLTSTCGSVQHSGDNRSGDGDGDDEKILVELGRVPAEIAKLIFVVNIYDCVNKKQDFGLIQNAYIRVVNQGNNQELLKFQLSEDCAGKTSLIVGEIYRNNSEWKFAALGEGTHEVSISEIVKRYA